MTISDFRSNARQTLQGKWGKAALIILVSSIAFFILGLLNVIPFIGSLAVSVISVPLTYGILATFIKFKRNEEYTYTTFLTEGLANFAKVWMVTLWTALKLLPWVILLAVAIILTGVGAVMAVSTSSATFGLILSIISFIAYVVSIVMLIVKGLAYVLAQYVLYDEPTLSAKEMVEKSDLLMKNNKAKFFLLNLSFIGWSILASLTFGIGLLWLTPYVMISTIYFYESLSGKKAEAPKEEVNPIQ